MSKKDAKRTYSCVDFLRGGILHRGQLAPFFLETDLPGILLKSLRRAGPNAEHSLHLLVPVIKVRPCL